MGVISTKGNDRRAGLVLDTRCALPADIEAGSDASTTLTPMTHGTPRGNCAVLSLITVEREAERTAGVLIHSEVDLFCA